MNSSVSGGSRSGDDLIDGSARAGVVGIHVRRESSSDRSTSAGSTLPFPLASSSSRSVQRSGKGIECEDFRPQLVGEPGIRRSQKCLPIAANRVGGADAGLDRAPGEWVAGVPVVLHGGQELRKVGIRRDRGGKVSGLLIVEACAEVDREVARLNRVREVCVVVVDEALTFFPRVTSARAGIFRARPTSWSAGDVEAEST